MNRRHFLRNLALGAASLPVVALAATKNTYYHGLACRDGVCILPESVLGPTYDEFVRREHAALNSLSESRLEEIVNRAMRGIAYNG